MSSLIVTVPAFWGQKDVNLILNFFVDRGGFSQNESLPQLDKLIKLLAKQIPSKVVIPSLLQCWPPNSELRTSVSILILFFLVNGRTKKDVILTYFNRMVWKDTSVSQNC